MKKSLAFLLALTMIFGIFAGCAKEQVDITPSTPPPTDQSGSNNEQPDGPGTDQPVEKETPKPEGEGTIKIAVVSDASSLNPHAYSMTRDQDVIKRLTMFLYKSFISEEGKSVILPELAADFPKQMNDERTVWNIPLREGLTWENGDVITADDVMYTYKMLLDPVLASSRASSFAKNYVEVKNAVAYNAGECDWDEVGLKKIDDHTIELTLAGPASQSELLNHFNVTSLGLVHEATYEANMSADRTVTLYGTSADTIISCGAFTLEDWAIGAGMTYKKNPNYIYQDKIWVAGISERLVADSSTRTQLFLNGEIDYAQLGDEEYKVYLEDPRFLTRAASSVKGIAVNMGNTEKPILQSENFRKALYYGINRDEVAVAANGIGTCMFQTKMAIGDLETGESYLDMFAKAHPDWVPENNGYDPVKAKEYFDKAMEETGTTKVELTLIYDSKSAQLKAACEYMQKSLAELFGADKFKLELQGMPSKQVSATMEGHKDNPNSYELGIGSWDTSKVAPWIGYSVWTTDGARKNEPLSIPELDELYERATSGEERFDKEVQLELSFQMEKLMIDHAGYIPVVEIGKYYLKSENTILPNPDNDYVVNVGFGWEYARVVE